MKKAVSIITAIALLLTMSISAFATQYGLDTPAVSINAGRSANFVSGGLYSPTLKQDAGTVTYDAEADDKIAGGKGLMVMQRFLEDGELYWQDYVNGVYGCGDGFIELPITKSSAQDAVQIHTNGGGYTVMVEWANDGKLYAKNRKNATDGDATSWNYICDIDGLSAKFTFYIYSDLDCYYIAVNDKIVSEGLYSMSANPTKSELVRITYMPGTAGTVWVDYKNMGSISSHTLIPAGVAIDATDVANGNITVNGTFLGYPAAASSDWKMFNALYTLNGELVKVAVADIASNITVSETSGSAGIVSTTLDIGDLNYKDLYVKTYIWSGNTRPTGVTALKYFYTTPVKTFAYNEVNALSYAPESVGTEYGTIENGDTSMKITRTVDTPEGETQYMALTNYSNRGYSDVGAGVISFTLTKSRKDMEGRFVGNPSSYIDLQWDENGEFWACYRDSADQDGTTAQWHKLGYKTDKLSVDVVAGWNGETSSYSLWLDGIPVIADKYSRAVYNNTHSVPGVISRVRIYTNEGKAGDVFSLTNYKIYGAKGFGDN